MMKKTQITRLALLIGSLALLTACTRSVSDVDSKGKTEKPVFPAQSKAVRAEGSFVNVDNLKQLRPGLAKAQVYEMLGAPHFKEGMLRVKEWDYIFHFTRADKSVRTCQFKVLFDSEMKAQSFYFLPEDCMTPKTAAPVVVKKELSAESLFAFASAQLSPEGVDHVNAFAADLKRESLDDKPLIVKGHTDRIGNSRSNAALSKARAESVKRLLVENGLSAERIETVGLGDTMPRVNCPGKVSPEVIACLAPNRRMSLEIMTNHSGD